MPSRKPRGKSHQNGEYLKPAMRKSCLLLDSNLQLSDYQSTGLPLKLEKMSPRMLILLNFGSLDPATCLFYDVKNDLVVMLVRMVVCTP